MLNFYAYVFWCDRGKIEEYEKSAASHKSSLPVSAEDLRLLGHYVQSIFDGCKSVGLDSALNRIQRIQKVFNAGALEWGTIQTEMRVLRETIEDQLPKRLFLFVAASRCEFYQRQMSFGPVVTDAFPSM